MTYGPPVTVPLLTGNQQPRIEHVPRPARGNEDAEAVIELAALAGLRLDPWQKYVLRGALGRDAADRWQAFEVGLIVPRQNGKGSILEALELAWLFLFDDDRLILHSAHEFKTASEAFLRIRGLIDGTPELRAKVKRISGAHGEEGVELHDGSRLRFVARSKGSGRGFSADKLVFDEAYNLPDVMIDATLPTTGARHNPQVWYTSSAADRTVAPCEALARVRRRGIAGVDPRLCFMEWSVPFDERTGEIDGDPADPAVWAIAQPSLGIRKPVDRVETFYRSMSPEGFAREELGVGNYPEGEEGDGVIPGWAGMADPAGTIVTRPVFAVEVTTDRSRGSVSVAGGRDDGRVQVERVAAHKGTGWIVPWVAERAARHETEVIVDPRSPAAPLVPDLEEAGVTVHVPTADEWVRWGGGFVDAAAADRIRHLGDPDLTAAMRATVTKRSRETWVFDRVNSRGDVTAFIGAVMAAGRYFDTVGADYDVLASVG